jgi:hypothetical protein
LFAVVAADVKAGLVPAFFFYLVGKLGGMAHRSSTIGRKRVHAQKFKVLV